MELEGISKSMQQFIAVAAFLSFGACCFLYQRYASGRELLSYEPRRRSPWGPLVLAIPLAIVGQSFAQLFIPAPSLEETTATDFVNVALNAAILQIVYVILVLGWFELDRKVTCADLGLPESFKQLCSDVLAGTVGCVAALLPVFLVNVILMQLLQVEDGHPLIERLMNSSSSAMLSAAFVSAVISAPIFEEVVFRLFLQGWLEKLEDESLGFQATERDIADEQSLQTAIVLRPSSGWLGLLPHGWLPIVISSVLFGLAHVGHGVAPIPLVLLGLVLGYLYQRTHRILPCIVAHMLFNTYTMVLLWLGLGSAGS